MQEELAAARDESQVLYERLRVMEDAMVQAGVMQSPEKEQEAATQLLQQREELRAQLSPLKLSALKKRAAGMGVDEHKLVDADDTDNIKDTVISLILEQEIQVGGTGSPGRRRAN